MWRPQLLWIERLKKHNICRLQVAMNYPQLLQVSQRTQQLDREPSNQTVVKSLIIVHLYELVQINCVKFEYQTQVISPHKIV